MTTTAYLPGCTGKRKFSNREMAVEVGSAKHRKFKKEAVLHPYLCVHCHCWHTSHETQEEHDAKQAEILARRERVGAKVRRQAGASR